MRNIHHPPQVYFILEGGSEISYNLVRLFASREGSQVITTSPDPESELSLLILQESYPNIEILRLDVSSEESIQSLADILPESMKNGVDVFISNPGLPHLFQTTFETTREQWISHYAYYVLGPLAIFQIIYPYLKHKDTRKAVFLSSIAGSIGEFVPAPCSPFNQLTAALNFSVKQLSVELDDEEFTVVAVYPGLVGTPETISAINKLDDTMIEDMASFFVTAEEAGIQVVDFVDKMGRELNSKFMNSNGNELVW